MIVSYFIELLRVFFNSKRKCCLSFVLKINEQFEELKSKISESKDKRIKLGVIPSFSLYKLHEKNYINESVVLVIENSTSILLEEIYKDNIDVVIGDITHLKITRSIHKKFTLRTLLWLMVMKISLKH